MNKTGKYRILLVEDNRANQKLAMSFLSIFNYQAECAPDGEQAIALLSSQPFDLVLMDIQLQGINGYQVTQMIRDPESSVLDHQLPVIAMSANILQKDYKDTSGFSDKINKPIDFNDLEQLLERWLPSSKSQDVASAPSSVNSPVQTEGDRSSQIIFDREGALKRLMGNEAALQNLLNNFLLLIPEQMEKLRNLAQSGEKRATAEQAHMMLSATTQYGGIALSSALKQLEQQAENANLNDLIAMVDESEQQYQRLTTKIAELQS